MDVIHLFWLSLVVGAAVFFAAGVLLRDFVRPSPVPSIPTPAANPDLIELDLSRRELAEVRAQLQKEAAIRQELEGQVRASSERANQEEERTQQYADQNAETAHLTGEIVRLEAARSQSERDLERLRAELKTLTERQKRATELETSLRSQLSEAQRAREATEQKLQAASSAPNVEVEKLQAKMAPLELALRDARAKTTGLEAEVARHRENVTNLEKARDKATEDLRATQDQLRTAKTQIAALESRAREVDSLRREKLALAEAAKEADALRAKSQELEAALEEAQAKIANLKAATEWAKGSDAERERDRIESENELREIQTQLREARAQIVTLESSVRDVERLRAENSSIRVELAELERQKAIDPGMDLPTFQRKNAELSLKERLFEQRMAEFERQAEENHALRMQVDSLETARSENEVLLRRIQSLEAHAFANQAPRRPSQKPGLVHSIDPSHPDLIDKTLAELVRDAGCHVAVLSDLRGLLIAAAGDHEYQEELAAAASLTTFATERMRELLPMSEPDMLEWVDTNQVALRASWLRTEDDAFLLTTMSLGEKSDSPVDRYRAVISQFLANTPSLRTTNAPHEHKE